MVPIRQVLFQTQAGSTGEKLCEKKSVTSYTMKINVKMRVRSGCRQWRYCLQLCAVFYLHGSGLILTLQNRSVGHHIVIEYALTFVGDGRHDAFRCIIHFNVLISSSAHCSERFEYQVCCSERPNFTDLNKNKVNPNINFLKPTGHVMHQQVENSTTVRSAHTVFMCFVFI
jgi:hypothetical protein